MSVTIEGLVADFADELHQVNNRYNRYVKIADEEGFSQLSKFFRAMAASETVRSKLILSGMNAHAKDKPDFFICPHCGLVFMLGAPDQCPVDETQGSLFEKIS